MTGQRSERDAVTDTTSWNAYLLGDPVRLVK
jgi:hypothetical protein